MKLFGLETSLLEQEDVNVVLIFSAFCIVLGVLGFSFVLRYASPMNSIIFLPSNKSSVDEVVILQKMVFPSNSIVVSSAKNQSIKRDTNLSIKQYVANNPNHTVFDMKSIFIEILASLFIAVSIFGLFWNAIVKKFLSHLS